MFMLKNFHSHVRQQIFFFFFLHSGGVLTCESQTTPRIDMPLQLKGKALLLDTCLLYFPRLGFTQLPVSFSTLWTSLLARTIARDGTRELNDPWGSRGASLTWKQSRIDWDIATSLKPDAPDNNRHLDWTAINSIFRTVKISFFNYLQLKIFYDINFCCLEQLWK